MLSPVDQHQVTILAALLRVADGLDATHRGIVEDLACRFSPRHIVVSCVVRSCPLAEREQALDKGDLLEHAFGRELLVEW
jgi:exopolyphosphatase/guanosine-5'-triphosphate,3'-diphosphate pyrophosphatase